MRLWAVGGAAFLFLTVGAERADLRADLPEKSARVVAYTIRAELLPAERKVKGALDLVWRNTSGEPVDHAFFHLYLNAFAKGSTYLAQSRGAGKARSSWDEDHPGSITILSMDRGDGVNLWEDATRSFVAPDDGNAKDRTLARVDLPAPVAPGETLALNITWESLLPRVLHRTGWAGDPEKPDSLFFMVAQWFPKIAVLRTDGEGPGRWNAHQFHKNTEFFSDYGVYQVSLKVPQGFTVGATGRRVGDTDNGDGTRTVVHRQEDVHDFAWTASPHFGVREYAWNFDRFCTDAPNGMGDRIRALLERTARHRGVEMDAIKPKQDVKVRILYQPDHEDAAERFLWAAGASICCYGIWFGQYPYDVLTIVDPPAGGMAAGGMEYPTLFTVFGDRHAPSYVTGMEGVTIHEYGHQYFYGLIGTNEFEEAWLDEGFTSFTDARVFEIAYGLSTARTTYRPAHTPFHRPFAAPGVFGRLRSLLGLADLPYPWKKPKALLPVPDENPLWAYVRDLPALHLDKHVRYAPPAGERNSWLASNTEDAMVMPGWHFASRRDYRVNSYPKPTVFLYCLRGLMGEAAFDRAMYAYASKHRFGHPTTEDVLAAFRAATPEEQRAQLDGFIAALLESSARLDAAILEASQEKLDDGGWEWTVRVQRRGAVPVPIEIHAEDAQGQSTVLATWQSAGRETTKTFRWRRDTELRVVRLGPDWLAGVDADLSNNARVVGSRDRRAATVLATRWTLFVEEIVRTYAGVSR